jgi:hypothetical protein
MRRIALLVAMPIALALALSSCAHAPRPQRGSAQLFALNEGQTANLSNGGRLTFMNVVNESRCPKGTNCVWAGTATARFRLQPDPHSRDGADVLAVLPGGVGRADAAGQLPVEARGATITLIELTPYPISGGRTAEGRRRALVRVVTRSGP